MDIFELIRSEHEKVKDLMSRIKGTDVSETRRREDLLIQLMEELLPHMHAEERLLYPFVMEQPDGEQVAYEAIEEHKAARAVMADLDRTPADDRRFDARVRVLEDLVSHHITEEEDRLFEKARQGMRGDRASQMAGEFQELEKQVVIGRML